MGLACFPSISDRSERTDPCCMPIAVEQVHGKKSIVPKRCLVSPIKVQFSKSLGVEDTAKFKMEIKN